MCSPIRWHDSPFACGHFPLVCKRCERRTRETRGEHEQTEGEQRKEALAAHKTGLGVEWQRELGYANADYTTPHFLHPVLVQLLRAQGGWRGLCVETRRGSGRTERRVVYALFIRTQICNDTAEFVYSQRKAKPQWAMSLFFSPRIVNTKDHGSSGVRVPRHQYPLQVKNFNSGYNADLRRLTTNNRRGVIEWVIALVVEREAGEK